MTTGEAPPPPSGCATAAERTPPAADRTLSSIKNRAVRGVGWTSFIHAYRIGVGLLTTWFLAILLGREAFGLVGSAAVIVGVLMLLKDLGTGAAIVQRRDLTPGVLASVFWTNVILGVAGTAALFAAAPVIGAVLGEPELGPIVRALAFMLLLAGLGTTHQSLLQRGFRFARLAKIESVAITAGAATGITAALLGAGVWALVLQSLVTTGATTGLAVLLHEFRPALRLRFDDVRSVARFSLNLTGFTLLNALTRSADQLIVLRCLGTGEAGLYYLSVKILLFPVSGINAILSRVLFPIFASIQDDDARLRHAFLRVTATIAMLVFPFLAGFAVLADPIVRTVLPTAWLPVAPIAATLTVVALVQCLSTSVGNVFMAKARTDLLLRIGLIACAASVAAFVIGVQFGTVGVAQAYTIVAALLFVPVMQISLGLIGTPFAALAAVVWRPGLAAALMGGLVAALGAALPGRCAPGMDLAIRVPAGMLAYVVLTLCLNGDHARQVLALARSRGRDLGAATPAA